MGSTIEDQRLDALFTALADRTRRDIVARLSAGEATAKELAEPYAMSMQALSQHIRVLERSGLICSPGWRRPMIGSPIFSPPRPSRRGMPRRCARSGSCAT